MKKILTFLTLMLLTLTTLFAQSNDKISYQAVIRNSANQLVVNSEVNVTISVANSQGGSAVYTETHTVTTNENGLMSLLVGEGTLVSGSWSDIDWSSAYVTSTMTVDGETLTHTVPVNAVPYALYADQVNPEALENALENYVTNEALQDAIEGIEFPPANWNATQGEPGYIENKPTIPTSVSDLQGADDLVTDEDLSDALEEIQDGLEENYATKSALADTAASIRSAIPAAANAGTVTLWQGTPNNPLGYFDVNTSENVSIEIPAQVQADWEETDTLAKSFIRHKPTNLVTSDDLDEAIEDISGELEELQEELDNYATKEELLADSNALANQITDLGTAIDNRIKADSLEVLGLYTEAMLKMKADSAAFINAIHDTAEVLRSEMPDAQVQADWTETNTDSKAFIKNKPTIPEAANNATLTITQGEDNTLGTFTANANEDVVIDIPSINLTAKDLENFIDTVTLPTALSVYGHVHDSLNPQIKEGLKLFVAQTVKNNPTYAMDVLTYYIENLTPAQVSEIFGAYDDMNSTQAKEDLLNGLAKIIKDNPDIAYDVLNHYIDNVDVPRALSVLPHIDTMDNGVKTGLKIWVAQVAKNNPTYVMDILTHYIENLTPAQVSEIFGAYDDMANTQAKSDFRDSMLEILDIPTPETQVQADWTETNADSKAFILNKPTIPEAANDATLTLKQGETTLGTFTADANQDVEIDIPSIDLTAKDLENFIDTVSLPTALSVYGHVHDSLNPQIKEGLKLFVAQTVKNNPTYAMDVLTHYIENLTQAQVSEIFGAYGDMNAAAKEDLLDSLASIIKNNPDIAYDVLNYYIDNVDVQRALSVLPHINSMDNGVKTGLKMWVAQVAKNNPEYVMDIAKYYVTYANNAVVDELMAADNDNALGYAFNKLAPNSIVPQMIHDSLANIATPTVNNATLTLKQGETTLGTFTADANQDVEIDIPSIDLTAKDLENFIDTVSLPTALSVYGHVHDSLNPQIKEGLKLFVAQTVKNNPTYAMDVLTHYIKNLTVDQVGQIVGAYNQMNNTSKDSVLKVVAKIIKDNPDIAYDVLIYYIDHVTVQQALPVYQHIHNNMDPDVKEGLKLFVAQTVKNNPEYILDVLKSYLNTPNATTKEEVVTQYAIAHRDVAKEIMVNYLQNGTAEDVNALVAALASNNAGGKTQFQNLLNAYIDSRIPTETSMKFSATAGQTTFTLNHTPKANYVVRLWINGVLVGDSATGVITVNGTTVTYVPAQNEDYILEAGNKIIISYFY